MSDQINDQLCEEANSQHPCTNISCEDTDSHYCTVKVLHSSETQTRLRRVILFL